MKRLIAMAIVALTVIEFVSAAPEVTDITAKQRYPWNGLVDIGCKVSGIEADAGGYEFVVVAVNKETGKEYTVSTFSILHNGEEVPDACGNGDYSLLWNVREDMGQVVIERMTVRITLEALAVSVGKVQLWEGGPYWADRNIGAKKTEDSGFYFWWGDTKGHRPLGGTFSFNFWRNNPEIYTAYWDYPYHIGKSVSELQSADWVTSDGALALAHDAAHVKWGGAWRMPTRQEVLDITNKCNCVRAKLNGVNGYIVNGRGKYAANSIFFPCAGYGGENGEFWYAGNLGLYWSSTPTNSRDQAYELYFYFSGNPLLYESFRWYGRSIRPVQ